MGEIIKLLANLANEFHDILDKILEIMGVDLSDKALHFIIFGLLGIVMFLVVNVVFKWVSKWSIELISFIYTFTFLAVFALSIEIQQKITGRGNMEFNDIVAGLFGFIVLIVIYAIIRVAIYYIKKLYVKHKELESLK